MQKKLVLVIFIILAAVLALAVIGKDYVSEPQGKTSAARLVIPRSGQVEADKDIDAAEFAGDAMLGALIPLRSDEILLKDVLTADFDGDGYEDQIAVVKNSADTYLHILVGLYDAVQQHYVRAATIDTRLTQAKSFSYVCMDLTGEHRNALVYQGMLENGNSVLQAYFIKKNGNSYALERIAALESNGSIFVQQTERNESYERSLAKGASFPIWVYSSDESKPDSTDQLRTSYTWNASQRAYVQAEKVRVAGSRIEAKELASIQDGTVATFANFLDGLWYKTENSAATMHYLFFDYPARQIIFFIDGNAEVYNWLSASLHYRGMSVSTTNLEIENLQRQVNVSLFSTDQVRVNITDNLGMTITEDNTWNGNYKKMKFSDLYEQQGEPAAKNSLLVLLEEKPWAAGDGTMLLFSEGTYTASGDSVQDSGEYTQLEIGGSVFLEFRSLSATPFFRGAYRASYAAPAEDEAGTVPERIVLQPSVIKADRAFASDDRPLILSSSPLFQTGAQSAQ
ncbi:MAG TPA: hypothetical protein DDW78_03425 [Treponema sp.]|nr:hypothetical protein [Treponema sp.]